MGSATPVRDELSRIQSLLTGDEPLTGKQRLALMVSHAAIEWMLRFKTDSATEAPSVAIMRSVPIKGENAENHPE